VLVSLPSLLTFLDLDMKSNIADNRRFSLFEADQVSGADLSRQALIDCFRQRISTGTRTRLSHDEFALLASSFVDRLKPLKSVAEIKQACAEEIALLEEGYSQASIASRYLPIYRRLIKDAIEQGLLTLSDDTSHPVHWQKRDRSDAGVSIEHFALSFLKYGDQTYAQLRDNTTIADDCHQPEFCPGDSSFKRRAIAFTGRIFHLALLIFYCGLGCMFCFVLYSLLFR
jgi:hypothetical protein